MHDLPEIPEPGQLFRHADGGVYRFVTTAKHAEDGTQMMVDVGRCGRVTRVVKHDVPFDVWIDG